MECKYILINWSATQFDNLFHSKTNKSGSLPNNSSTYFIPEEDINFIRDVNVSYMF